jgi:hypothetical protein
MPLCLYSTLQLLISILPWTLVFCGEYNLNV